MRGGKGGLVALLVAVMLGVAACGAGTSSTPPTASATATPTTAAPTATATASGTGGSAATITMARASFQGNTNVTIKAGQAVTFDDPASGGGIHNLVTGTGGSFTATPGAPSQFASASGMSFGPGTTVAITFANAGTYNITCTIHTSMQATITVTP